MSSEFKGKNVLLIDDSIVRGTTSREIIQMARDAGAKSVTFASAAPPVRFPHVYGINMPSRHELVAYGRTIPEIAKELGADYSSNQEVEDLRAAILEGSDVEDLDMSCFDGRYVTGTVTTSTWRGSRARSRHDATARRRECGGKRGRHAFSSGSSSLYRSAHLSSYSSTAVPE